MQCTRGNLPNKTFAQSSRKTVQLFLFLFLCCQTPLIPLQCIHSAPATKALCLQKPMESAAAVITRRGGGGRGSTVPPSEISQHSCFDACISPPSERLLPPFATRVPSHTRALMHKHTAIWGEKKNYLPSTEAWRAQRRV